MTFPEKEHAPEFDAGPQDLPPTGGAENDLSEKMFHALFETASMGIAQADPHTGRWVRANRKLCEITGYSLGEILERSVPGITHPEDRERDWAAFQRVVRGEEPNFHREQRYIRKDGAVAWVNVNMTIVRDGGGEPLHTLALIEDITERRQLEDSLRESHEMFSEFMRHSPIYVFIKEVTPRESRVLQASENFEQMVGIPGRNLIGKTMAEAFPAEFAAKITADDWAVVEAGTVLRVDEDLHGRNYTTVKFPIVQGGKTLLAGYTIDITERKQAEEERVRLEGQLLQAQKMESVGRLAGGVAHDFNNMLGVILGHAEMALCHTVPTQRVHHDLVEIQKAAQRSAALTKQLLAFARKQAIAPRELELNDVIAGMLKMLQRIIGENINLSWEPGASLWPVRMDPSQLDQILANLCVNARDAIADVGRITIKTENATLDKAFAAGHAGFVSGEYVRLTVRDNGCGMDAETQAHIFEPFFTTKGVGVGTGLGLATAYGAVKQNNGFIHATSAPGLGATFTIHLPRSGKTAAPAAPTEEAAAPAPRGEETLLLVEDEPAVLAMTKMMLENQGYTVLAASTPDEAMRLAQEHAAGLRLLVTDVIMPDMNGRELADRLLARHPRLKRLFMSGYTADVICASGVLEPGVHFIQKPFTLQGLAAKVREALESEPSRP